MIHGCIIVDGERVENSVSSVYGVQNWGHIQLIYFLIFI